VEQKEFHRYYHTYSQRIYNFIVFMIRNRHASEDILQGVFLSAWRHDGGPQEEEQRLRWLYTIARHQCMDYFRSVYRFAHLRAQYSLEVEPQQTDPLAKMTWEMLDDVDPVDRSILFFHLRIGYTHAEIAKMLNMNENQVRTRACRALRRLREQYKKEDV
jgi:RNA polymerase sigma-70 factor (ECF subfamily)